VAIGLLLLVGSETRLGRREHSVRSLLREFHAPAPDSTTTTQSTQSA